MENIKTLLAAVAQTTGFGDDEPVASTPSELGMESYGSPAVAQGDEITGDAQPVGGVVADLKTAVPVPVMVNGGVEKKKRGRPRKGQLPVKPPPVKRVKVEEEEEDVCFICFDGGSLVLCDRKGCPKAYHPACIKRDEAFFKSKAKWNCGWHICSVCMKTSHYLCYTCTYSLCKGCTKDTDYVCVRGNKGFCSTCMKTIMLIENKDQAISESIQVDFDDKLSWEYLFKMYWVLLKESLSLTLSELTQAKGPWKGLAAVTRKPRLNNVLPSAVGGEVSMSNRTTGHLELNKPHAECKLVSNDGLSASLPSNGNHVEKLNCVSGNHGPSNNKEIVKPNIDKVTRETSIDEVTEKSGSKKSIHDSCIEKDLNVPSIVEDATKPCYQKNAITIESDRPVNNRTEWASEDLLEFVKHVKNGDTSALSQFDVQTLLLDYIKRNNLLDPYQKSKIVCDQRLKNLFGRAHIDYTEMLKLLESHFLLKEDSQKNSFIPAELVKSVADGNMNGSPKPINRRKRKMCRKSEDKVAKIDLNEYAAIDAHNINLIYLRRNLMETLIENCENFSDKVIGYIVRIKISADDQKPEVHRLVQVIGTCKVSEPYKIGNRTIDVMLEVLNLDRKEVVSIVSISNDEFSEDECKWLRQSIKCGLVKQFTVDEVKMKAMALQSVRVYDYRPEAEISQQNHLRDPAGKKEIKKENYVDRLQLLKSAEEARHRISQVPEIHVDPTMNPNYESEEDTRSGDRCKKEKYVPPSYSSFPQNDWDPLSSSNEKEKEEQSAEAQTRITEKTDASGSNDLDKHTDQIVVASSLVGGKNDQAIQRSGLETSIATASLGDSRPADNIETEKLWHYRDPNSKIQGPFSMMQLRKCSTSGLFPPDMRIWTNHEQFDALLLTDALNGKFHGAPDLSHKAASSSPQENRPSVGIDASEGTNRASGDDKQTEVAECNSSGVLSESRSEPLKTDELCSSGWPRCWDLLKDSNPSVEGVEVCDLLPSSKSEARDEALTDRGRESDEIKHSSQNGENNSIGLTQNSVASGDELQNQPKDEDRAGQSSEGNLRSLNIDLSSNNLESVPVFTPLSKSLGSSKQAENIDVLDLLTPKTANQQFLTVDPEQGLGFLELLSPAPRSNNESQGVQETDTKLSGFINLPMSNSGSDWIGASNLGIGGVQLPDVADEWCGYSHTAARPSTAEWDSGLVSASCSRPPEVNCENTNTLAPDGHQLAHASSSHPTSNGTNWLAILNEPIEFVALGEDSVSDLLAEVDAMESRGVLPSPTSALKFAREFLEDCRDDCFSSIEDFSSAPEPRKSDAFSSTSDVNLTTQSSAPCKQNGTSPVDAFDFFRRSSVNSSASSEGETSAAVHSGDAGSEFHPPAPHNTNQEMVGGTMAPVPGSDATDPGWGQMQGNINLVTVQGNVNLVLGGPTQGMANLGWGTNPGPGWANPNAIRSPRNGSLPWDGQRKYGGERFNCPREWGRPPWGRQPAYGSGGGYSRPLPKGQRVCKFYESGHCKKGAFCDYLHP